MDFILGRNARLRVIVSKVAGVAMVSVVLTTALAVAGAEISQAANLATVNGRAITDQDLMTALSGVAEGQRRSMLSDERVKRQIIDSLIDQELLTQEGEKARLENDAEFKAAMANFRKQYMVNKVLERNLSSKMTEKAAKKYYNLHKNRFSTDRAHVMHILMSSEAEARKVLAEAKKPKADFQDLAEKHSKDPSAKNNRGDLGMVTRDAPFVEPFKEAVFKAGSGDIVGPVKTEFGFHVIYVKEKKVGRPLEYDEVELKVKNAMKQELIEGYLGNLKKQAKIQISEDALRKL